jgi:hypothetical protein
MTTTVKTPSTTVKTPLKSPISKKEVRHQIAVKLEAALVDLKSGMGEKKFKNRIKKASKLFSDHFAPAVAKKSAAAPKTKPAKTAKPAPTKKAAKKAAPAKAAPPSKV